MSHKDDESRPQHVRKWWATLLLFPWLQISPIMPGREGDDQIDRLKKLRNNPTEPPVPDPNMPTIPATPPNSQLPNQNTGRQSIRDIPRRVVGIIHWPHKR